MNSNSQVLLYTGSLSGHRASYLSFASSILKGRRATIKEVFFRRDPVLFLMIEDSFFLYVMSSFWRTLFGRRTAGLLFRPKPTVESDNIRLGLKRIFLKFLKMIPSVNTLLIVPETVHPGFSSIADGWIYDFQFWDVSNEDYELLLKYKKNIQKNKLSSSIQNIALNRTAVIAIGAQHRYKGFDIFLEAYATNKEIRKKFLFAFGGKVERGFETKIESFIENGGFSLDRFVTDEELVMLYASSNLIWSLYSEEYDQASGIFGRAVQFGIPVVVRTGSLIHGISEQEDIPHIALTKGQISLLATKPIHKPDIIKGKAFRNYFKEKSIEQLSRALGIRL